MKITRVRAAHPGEPDFTPIPSVWGDIGRGEAREVELRRAVPCITPAQTAPPDPAVARWWICLGNAWTAPTLCRLTEEGGAWWLTWPGDWTPMVAPLNGWAKYGRRCWPLVGWEP